jgi:hypothetical protein
MADMNEIATKTVIELIVNENTPDREPKVEKYIIPYYQRGYRWENRHVEYLLKDIDDFIKDIDDFIKDDNDDYKSYHRYDYYCLQPIVVTPAIDDEEKIAWEVIDGQQRLITLYLIFKYINKRHYQLHFQNRVKSNRFIKNISENSYDHDKPDFHYMSEAHKTVKEFIDRKMDKDPSYADTFYMSMKRVKVIWYRLYTNNESEKIDVFNRLNIGKIPLTDSELIRALLLSRIKNPDNERESILRQTEVSEEWNRIEHELRNKEFWYFLKNEKFKNDAAHIEFLFNLIAGEESENYSTYLWFETELKKENAEKLWSKVKQVFGQLKSWYNKRTLYHYIGYILIINSKTYSIDRLLKKQSEFSNKTGFCQWLKNEIRGEIKNIDLKEISYDKDWAHIKNILLLFNILSLEKLSDIPQNRFPFYRYKDVDNNGGWSIEHIHAQNSEELKDSRQIKEWLDDTLDVLEKIKVIEKNVVDGETDEKKHKEILLGEYVENIKVLIDMAGKTEKKDEFIADFNNLKNELSIVFDSHSVDELSNLALLGKKDNSALQNFLFPVKRDKIMQLERENHFIPYCTKNVFLKAYSKADTQPYFWSEADKETYFKEIKNIIDSFKNE